MPGDTKALFEERLGRYQAAIALEPADRIPIAPGTLTFAEAYSGNSNQETIYDPERWLQGEIKFMRAFPATDTMRHNRFWGPQMDVLALKNYKLPGRDLSPWDQIQFVEAEYMKEDEYDFLISDPVEFMFSCWFPRFMGEMDERGSARSYLAFLKSGMAQAGYRQIAQRRAAVLAEECGAPQPMMGFFLAPFDALADSLRGLTGVFMDVFRQPEKVEAACDRLVEEMANLALWTADPLKRYPIFVPTHKACFMSPEQFDRFYWPSFKKVLEILIGRGCTVRAFLEGDWGPHWHHLLELPKGTIVCDIDDQGDIFQAKKDIGHHQCLAGGIQSSQFILGDPEDIRARVRKLCEEVGEGGGFIIGGGCHIPYSTKPENYQAMCEAILEYGVYDPNARPRPRPLLEATVEPPFSFPKTFTSWEQKKQAFGGAVTGDEALIAGPWEELEAAAYAWLWQWVL
ncbi:MAG: uroporphyrinogen decarboxylase family protein [Thermoleophilia bacterium]